MLELTEIEKRSLKNIDEAMTIAATILAKGSCNLIDKKIEDGKVETYEEAINDLLKSFSINFTSLVNSGSSTLVCDSMDKKYNEYNYILNILQKNLHNANKFNENQNLALDFFQQASSLMLEEIPNLDIGQRILFEINNFEIKMPSAMIFLLNQNNNLEPTKDLFESLNVYLYPNYENKKDKDVIFDVLALIAEVLDSKPKTNEVLEDVNILENFIKTQEFDLNTHLVFEKYHNDVIKLISN